MSDDLDDAGAVCGEVERGNTSQDGVILDFPVVEEDVEEVVAVLDVEGEEGLGGVWIMVSESVLRL